MVSWPDHHRVVLGHPNSHPHRDRSVRPVDFGSNACGPFPSLRGGAGAKGTSCMDTNRRTLASPPEVSLAFTKAFKRKGKLCSFCLSFLSACPCVLLPLSVSSHAVSVLAGGSRVGVGLRLHLGIVLIKLVYVKKGIIIIKPLMVSRESGRYSCSRGLTCSSQHFLSLYTEFQGPCAAADFVACLKYLRGAGRNNRGLAQGMRAAGRGSLRSRGEV